MSLYVVAQERAAFTAWLETQRAEVRVPQDELAQRGYRAFFAGGCGACHSVRGTAASGRIGPDLTHVGGRGFIAGGTMPTRRDTLRAWIADNQDIKPHNRMPEFAAFAAEDLDAIAAWLETLK
jgi:cytochrome c oxidase subunit 2